VDPAIAEALEDPVREAEVRAAHQFAVVVDERIERAVAELDLALARLDRLYPRSSSASSSAARRRFRLGRGPDGIIAQFASKFAN
jgi:hypothetical protein